MSRFFELFGRECVFLISSTVLVLGSHFLGSTFYDSFITGNLVQLQIALLAINTTTLSVILAKLREVATANIFNKTFAATKGSVVEQVVLIIAALILLILKDCSAIISCWQYAGLAILILLSDVLLHCIQITYDTAQAIFILFETL